MRTHITTRHEEIFKSVFTHERSAVHFLNIQSEDDGSGGILIYHEERKRSQGNHYGKRVELFPILSCIFLLVWKTM